jgi:hypothetical protein
VAGNTISPRGDYGAIQIQVKDIVEMYVGISINIKDNIPVMTKSVDSKFSSCTK